MFSNLVGLFALIGVGFFAVRYNILPASASQPMTTLLMKITLPATIFASLVRPFDPSFLRDAAAIFLLGTLAVSLNAFLSLFLSRVFRVTEHRRGMWVECATFCNNGFMGYPVAYALFGDDGLALAVILGIIHSLLSFTLGAKFVIMDCPADSEEAHISWRSVIFSVINLSLALGLVVYCCQIPVPSAILTPIQNLANVTTPLSMMVTGMNLANGKVADVIRDRDAVTSSLTRLLIFPLLTWLVIQPIPLSNPLVKGVLLIITAMPSPAAAVVMAEQYHGCVELGARTVFLSSLFCIVTMPLIAMLL